MSSKKTFTNIARQEIEDDIKKSKIERIKKRLISIDIMKKDIKILENEIKSIEKWDGIQDPRKNIDSDDLPF